MNRRALLLGIAGGLGMARVNKPSIVVPGNAHLQVQLEKLGVTGAKTIGQRTVDLSADKVRGRKPNVIDGSWADGTAGQSLVEALHLDGVVNDATLLGEPPIDVLSREAMIVYAELAAIDPSTSDTVNWADVIEIPVTIPTGQRYRVHFLIEASFTNSGGGINDLRLIDNDVLTLVSGTPTTQATRERYALDTNRIYDSGTWTWTFQYRPNAGTATARAPWMLLFFERLA